ncbi:MAG: hypothetical protein KUG77_19160 [Nannocystaceae bacterium]|nr:hypothetical protein [Nannocystaceae bacterium]
MSRYAVDSARPTDSLSSSSENTHASETSRGEAKPAGATSGGRGARRGLKSTVLVIGSRTRAIAAVATALIASRYQAVLALSHKDTREPRQTRSKRCFLLPSSHSEGYIEALLSVARCAGASVVVPTEHVSMWLAANARQQFVDCGIALIAPEPDVLELCRDRRRLLERLETVVPVPGGHLVPGGPEAWFVRKRDSFRGDTARIVAGSRGAPTSEFDEEHAVEYLSGEEIWVDVVRGADGSVQTGQSNLVNRGGRARLVGPTPEDELVRSFSVKAAGAIDLVGHATVRFRCDFNGDPRVIDVMPGFVSSSIDESGALTAIVQSVLDAPVGVLE